MRFCSVAAAAMAMSLMGAACAPVTEDAELASRASGYTDGSAIIWPTSSWMRATPAEAGLDEAKLREARDYALTGDGAGYITRRGRLVISWGDATERYDLKSTTKSIGATALGLAIQDGKVKLSDKAQQYHPGLGVPPESNLTTGWIDQITLAHLATQTAGFEKPGGYTALSFAPGTKWSYSDGGPNWLAECLTLLYERDLQELMFERIFTPLGIQRSDLVWRDNQYRPEMIRGINRREFGSGIHANVDAMARIGYLYLRGGRWKDMQLIPETFVDMARTTVPQVVGLPTVKPESYYDAPNHYGLLWWNNADGTLAGVPRDAYWSWGLYDSLIVVIPSLEVVAARAGKSWGRDFSVNYARLKPFLEPIVAAVLDQPPRGRPPRPLSRVISGIAWSDVSTIVRKAEGSDNWPLTWADDDNLYTAYGDGRGFEPKVPNKLSLGLAKIVGPPTNFRGINIISPSAERTGAGAWGEKASGMLMVDGTLYMWVRNAGNSRLASSRDRGNTWSWSEWTFNSGFGHPTFLNFGKNYAGAPDPYVYTYSHDHDSAYEPADTMVLARVPKDRITERAAYEFFQGLDETGEPTWTKDILKREAVFVHPGRCYRSSVSYNAALGRYLWCQIIPGKDTRFQGGFGVYDAPEPWGPWTTVYFTESWDVGPGENCHIPTKWISADGLTIYLVFSGDDSFSVRKGILRVEADTQ